jgi:hypothetical protein
MLRPVPTRLGALRFGADPAPSGPKPGFYTDTGGYAWELSPNGTLTTIASPAGLVAFAPGDPQYPAILAKITAGKTPWIRREQVMRSAVDQGGRDLSLPGAAVPRVTTSAPRVATSAPAASVTASPAANAQESQSSMPGWVLPAAAVTGAAGLALILFPNLLTPWGAPPAPAGRWAR